MTIFSKIFDIFRFAQIRVQFDLKIVFSAKFSPSYDYCIFFLIFIISNFYQETFHGSRWSNFGLPWCKERTRSYYICKESWSLCALRVDKSNTCAAPRLLRQAGEEWARCTPCWGSESGSNLSNNHPLLQLPKRIALDPQQDLERLYLAQFLSVTDKSVSIHIWTHIWCKIRHGFRNACAHLEERNVFWICAQFETNRSYVWKTCDLENNSSCKLANMWFNSEGCSLEDREVNGLNAPFQELGMSQIVTFSVLYCSQKGHKIRRLRTETWTLETPEISHWRIYHQET